MTDPQPDPLQAPPGADRVAAVVASVLGSSPTSVERVAGSVENIDFLVRTPAADVVVKIGEAAGLGAEVWACEPVRRVGVRAPEILDTDLGEPSKLGRPCIVIRCVDGAPATSGVMDDEVAYQVGQQLRQVHTLPVDGFGHLRQATDRSGRPCGPHATWAGFTTEPLTYLDEMVDQQVLDSQLAARIRTALHRHVDAIAYEGGGVLLHGDLKPGHLFATEGRLTGIIDWGDVVAGDPLFDLAPLAADDSIPVASLLTGYGLAMTSALETRMSVYRIIRTTLVLYAEYRSGGDWFAAYRDRITAELRNTA